MGKLYLNKKNRDEAFKAIPKEKRSEYRRSSVRNQLIHPMYIEDYQDKTGYKLTAQDKGFGNNLYRSWFPVLYELNHVIYF